jgi:hypothetical protein
VNSIALRRLIVTLAAFAFATIPSGALVATAEESAKKEAPESPEIVSQQQNEVRCSADISYLWERRMEPDVVKDDKGKKEPKAPEKTQEHYQTVFETASNEQKAQQKLEDQLANYKSDAFEACQNKHSNMANCVAGGIRKNSSEYRLLDFSARRTILKALEEDCRAISGRCLSTNASKISCSIVADAVEVPAARPAEKAQEE